MRFVLLWQQGKRAEVYGLLAPIYGWFTEEFDTSMEDVPLMIDHQLEIKSAELKTALVLCQSLILG